MNGSKEGIMEGITPPTAPTLVNPPGYATLYPTLEPVLGQPQTIINKKVNNNPNDGSSPQVINYEVIINSLFLIICLSINCN
jgi:hypothetical protein